NATEMTAAGRAGCSLSAAEFLGGDHGGCFRGEAERLDDLRELAALLQLGEHFVVGIAKRRVILVEGSAGAIDRRVLERRDHLDVRVVRLAEQIVERERGQR